MAAPLRSEIDNEFKWAVNDIYSSDNAWEEDYHKLIKQAGEPCEYQSVLTESADNLYNVLKELNDTDYLVERLYVYAFMRYYEDTANSVYQDMSGRAQTAAAKCAEKYAFVEPAILSMDENVLYEYLKDDRLKLYKHMIEDMLSQKEHSLSEKEEVLLAKASQVMSVPNEIFSKFNNADVHFGSIIDESGNKVELTNGTYVKYMQSQQRSVRKEAFECLYKEYKQYINTLAACFYGNVKQAVFKAEARKYESTLHMYLSDSFIPVDVYKNLINTVDDNLNLMHRYVDIRKKALGVDELHFYDIYAPMVADYEWKVTYDEARQMVLEALAPMGEEYLGLLQEGFDNRWIDVYENEGKRSGAYSWGVYGCHPYVLLNFHGTLNDVFTLAHEMGHSIHTWYSNKNQSYTYSGYKIFVAEVASTCNEALLIRHLLKNSKDKQEKAYLLNYFLESFRGTLFRQTMFAEFEQKAHEMAAAGESMTSQSLCNIYKKLNEDYFGPDTVIDPEIQYEWERIPHFYTPFYVYQYATGFSAAIAISRKIFNGEPGILEGYKKFLSSGCSDTPIELLKLAGVDMSHTGPVEEALKFFEELLNEFEELA